MYAKVPAIEGMPQVGSRHLYQGVSISSTEAVVEIDGTDLETGWVELTEEEFRAIVPKSTPEPTEQEIFYAEVLLGQAEIVESNAAIEETVAMLLLQSVEGVTA